MNILTRVAAALLLSWSISGAQAQAADAAASKSGSTAAAMSPAKKELIQKILQAQQESIHSMARGLVERPAGQMWQAAVQALQTQVPADKREAAAKGIQADLKKYVDETTPLVQDRAVKLGPTVLGPILNERFSEDELRQLLAWVESPVNKKFQSVAPEIQSTLAQKLVAETAPTIDPKLRSLEQKVRTHLGLPAEPPQGKAPASKATSSGKGSKPEGK